jgi:hypothetical protein
MWLAIAVAYVGAMTIAAGHAGMSSATGLLIGQQVLACVVAISAAYAAVLSVVPGRRVQPFVWMTFMGAAAWIGLLAFASIAGRQTMGVVGGLARETDWPCVVSMLIGGGALAGLLIGMLRRGAPMAPRESVALAAAAAAAIGSMEACATRPHAFISTILIWHGGTAVVMLVALALAARPLLRWPRLQQV